MKKVTLTFLTVALVYSACKKDDTPLKPAAPNTGALYSLSSIKALTAGNSANPFDSIGIFHNVVLDSIRQYVVQTTDTSREGRSAYLNEFLTRSRGIDFMPTYDPELERNICNNYKSVLMQHSLSAECVAILKRMTSVLEQIQSPREFALYAAKIKAIEQDIITGNFTRREATYMLIVSSVLRHSGYYWMEAFDKGYVTQKCGLLGFLRKVAGVIAAIGADATTAGWHYVKNSPYDHICLESAWMSEVCGYYTGWW